MTEALLDTIANYYSGKLAEHGETPQGVDWNGEESQVLRFQQLCRILPSDTPFSVSDLGCGYGALYEHLDAHYPSFSYLGVDVSAEMVTAAQARTAARTNARFLTASSPDTACDFGIASGIFNVRLKHDDDAWEQYIYDTLDTLNRTSTHGFSFNCLTSYSDADKKRDYLYYADPCKLFDHCKRHYSRNVALLHDYGLYEFTLLVRKTV